MDLTFYEFVVLKRIKFTENCNSDLFSFSLVFATDLCVLLGYVSCLLKLLALQCSLCFLTRIQWTFQKKKKEKKKTDHDLNLFKGPPNFFIQ